MAWRQILPSTELQSEEFSPSQPFVIIAEGSLMSITVTIESRRREGTVWNPVYIGSHLVAEDPSLLLAGLPNTVYRVNVSAVGVDIFYNDAYVSSHG